MKISIRPAVALALIAASPALADDYTYVRCDMTGMILHDRQGGQYKLSDKAYSQSYRIRNGEWWEWDDTAGMWIDRCVSRNGAQATCTLGAGAYTWNATFPNGFRWSTTLNRVNGTIAVHVDHAPSVGGYSEDSGSCHVSTPPAPPARRF